MERMSCKPTDFVVHKKPTLVAPIEEVKPSASKRITSRKRSVTLLSTDFQLYIVTILAKVSHRVNLVCCIVLKAFCARKLRTSFSLSRALTFTVYSFPQATIQVTKPTLKNKTLILRIRVTRTEVKEDDLGLGILLTWNSLIYIEFFFIRRYG